MFQLNVVEQKQESIPSLPNVLARLSQSMLHTPPSPKMNLVLHAHDPSVAMYAFRSVPSQVWLFARTSIKRMPPKT